MSEYDFWNMLEDCLPRDYNCGGCGKPMWMQYGDGHVWYNCLNCDWEERRKETVFEIAGYVSDWPNPKRPAPDTIIVEDDPEKHNDIFAKGEHEKKFYRRR